MRGRGECGKKGMSNISGQVPAPSALVLYVLHRGVMSHACMTLEMNAHTTHTHIYTCISFIRILLPILQINGLHATENWYDIIMLSLTVNAFFHDDEF